MGKNLLLNLVSARPCMVPAFHTLIKRSVEMLNEELHVCHIYCLLRLTQRSPNGPQTHNWKLLFLSLTFYMFVIDNK